jgi:hypothetical protein
MEIIPLINASLLLGSVIYLIVFDVKKNRIRTKISNFGDNEISVSSDQSIINEDIELSLAIYKDHMINLKNDLSWVRWATKFMILVLVGMTIYSILISFNAHLVVIGSNSLVVILLSMGLKRTYEFYNKITQELRKTADSYHRILSSVNG